MPETTQKRHNRVFKSLHKPLTYMGTSGSARQARSRATSMTRPEVGCTSTRRATSTTVRLNRLAERMHLSTQHTSRLMQSRKTRWCNPTATAIRTTIKESACNGNSVVKVLQSLHVHRRRQIARGRCSQTVFRDEGRALLSELRL